MSALAPVRPGPWPPCQSESSTPPAPGWRVAGPLGRRGRPRRDFLLPLPAALEAASSPPPLVAMAVAAAAVASGGDAGCKVPTPLSAHGCGGAAVSWPGPSVDGAAICSLLAEARVVASVPAAQRSKYLLQRTGRGSEGAGGKGAASGSGARMQPGARTQSRRGARLTPARASVRVRAAGERVHTFDWDGGTAHD